MPAARDPDSSLRFEQGGGEMRGGAAAAEFRCSAKARFVKPEFDWFAGDCEDCPDEDTRQDCSIGGSEAVSCPFGRTSPCDGGEANPVNASINPKRTLLEQRLDVDKRVEEKIRPVSAYITFVKRSAQMYINSAQNERASPYVGEIRKAKKALGQSYQHLSSLMSGNTTGRLALQDIVRYAFLIGLVNDRTGMTYDEFRKIALVDKSNIANNKRWEYRRECNEKLRDIAIAYLRHRKAHGGRMERIGRSECQRILRDKYFKEIVAELGMEIKNVTATPLELIIKSLLNNMNEDI